MSGERILVIDDRRENLLFLAESVLRPEGYEVITAVDGKQGLDKALAEKPDLIITDLRMPRLSGLELMAALRKEQSNIPVILTTFYGSEQAAIEAFRLGAKDYIVKPYEIRDMLDSVERALIERRLRRETMDLQEGVGVRQYLEERVRQLHSLCGIGKALFALTDAEELMCVVVEASIYLTDAACGQLFLINAATQQVEVRAVRGPSESRAACVQQTGADQTTMQVIQTGRAMIAEQENGRRQSVSRLVVPMRIEHKVVGALGVDAKPAHSFNENDRYLMAMLADFAATALYNAQKFEELGTQGAALPGQGAAQAAGAEPRKGAPDLSDSIVEAERLSRELRNLAAAAQVLAAKLQVANESS